MAIPRANRINLYTKCIGYDISSAVVITISVKKMIFITARIMIGCITIEVAQEMQANVATNHTLMVEEANIGWIVRGCSSSSMQMSAWTDIEAVQTCTIVLRTNECLREQAARDTTGAW